MSQIVYQEWEKIRDWLSTGTADKEKMTITDAYEKMMELWNPRRFSDAISCFNQRMRGSLLDQKQNESFSRNLRQFWDLVEVECQENPEVMFNLYKMLKKVRDWDDETLCRRLRINGKAIEDIKNNRNPRSKSVGLKMLYELFPQMAV